MSRFEGITDDSLRMQIKSSARNIRQHVIYENWPAAAVSAQHAAEMDAELRRRHNERTFPERRRTA